MIVRVINTQSGIANIHGMRDSLQKLETLCLSGNEDQWYSTLEATKWLDHTRFPCFFIISYFKNTSMFLS